jgi:hypothetical protein
MAGGLYWKKLSQEEKEYRRATRRAEASRSLQRRKQPTPRTKFALQKSELERLYSGENKSMQEIAHLLGCSLHKVSYWMEMYRIPKRSLSDAIYAKHHPGGDPFSFRKPRTIKESELFGMGIGLYWGEGARADRNSVKLGNTDPKLLNTFIRFLETFFCIHRNDMRFGLQIFSDIRVEDALDFWTKNLRIRRQQFYKPTVTRSGSIGTYRRKSRYGVLMVHYHNKRMRDLLVGMLPL